MKKMYEHTVGSNFKTKFMYNSMNIFINEPPALINLCSYGMNLDFIAWGIVGYSVTQVHRRSLHKKSPELDHRSQHWSEIQSEWKIKSKHK